MAPAQNQMWPLCFRMSTVKSPRKNSILFCVDISKDLFNIYPERCMLDPGLRYKQRIVTLFLCFDINSTLTHSRI